MRAVKLLTEFIDQLKISALKPQLINFLVTSLTREGMGSIIDLTDPANEEARWALANSNVPNDSAKQINVLNAKIVLTNNAFVFTTGKDTAEYVTNADDAFTICCAPKLATSQNYEALLKSFDEPFTAVNALLKVIQDKGEELKASN